MSGEAGYIFLGAFMVALVLLTVAVAAYDDLAAEVRDLRAARRQALGHLADTLERNTELQSRNGELEAEQVDLRRQLIAARNRRAETVQVPVLTLGGDR